MANNTNISDRIKDQDLTEEKRNELIADYQRIVDYAESGKDKIEKGMVLFAKGRLNELRRASR